MNKIFKTIFSKRTNSFVVVSELTNTNGKASSTTDERKSTYYATPSKFASLLVLGSAVLTSQAFAGHTQIGTHSTGGDTTVSGNNAVAIGEGAIATGSDNAIAIGAKFHGSSSKPTEGAQALGDNSIAIGQASKASTSQSIAIGQYAEITDTATQSITIGANTKVSGASSIAIGGDDAKGTDYHTWQYDDSVGRAVDKKSAKFDATSAEGSVALAIGIKTQAKANGSIALGVVSTAGGKESISIGAKSATKGTNAIALGTAASGIANNAIALGTDAVADLEGSVVLGANSTTKGSATQIKTTDKAEVGGYVYDGFAGTITSEGDLVSIGNNTPGKQRKLINVAAGEITKQSTEAINGSQLYAVIDKINKANNGEAGPSVYTDPAGNRLVKANDGKYYPTNQVGADGEPLVGATAADNPILSVVNPDGTTATPTAMGNIKSTVGLDSAAGQPIDAATAQTNVGKLLEAKDGLNNAATVGDLQALAQAGLDFTGNNNTDTVHRALGTKLAIEGEGSWDGTNSAANNLFVQADPGNNKLVVKMNQALTGLTSVETKDANGNVAKLTPAGTEVTDAKGNSANYGANGLTVKDGNGNTTTIGAASTTVSNGTDTTTITPGAITGLKDLTDASDGSSAVNKNYVDAKLGNTVSSVGTGKDGRDGKDGLDGTGAAATGLTNADGLNGKSLTDKVNALRNGEAGPSVYTDPAGNRLVKANDGKYYPTNQVGADGQPVAGATAADNPILSVVNPDGTTATPTTMGNIKSTVGLDSAAGQPIDAATAQTNVGKLLEAKDGLNNAATVGDLQALAQAGLDFTGNNNTDTVHRALGTKLAIEGEGSWDGTNSAANNLFVQADPGNNKLVVKMNQALTGLTSVETKDANGNVAKLTPAGTEVTDAKGNSANYGANGLTVKDANGNSANYGANGLTVKDANGNTAISLASTNGTSSLNFAMDSNGNGTGKITGIAPGKISANSTDVVTGGQLYTLQNNVKNLTTGLNNKLNNLNAKVNRNNRQLRGGIATVTAMTNIPQVTFAGKSAVGIGVGTYENEGAISVGFSRMSDNGRVIMKVSAGASTEDTFNAGAGVAFQW